MFDSLRMKLVGLAAALSLGTCAGCQGTSIIETQSQPEIERIFEATDTTLEDALAFIDVYNAGVLSVAEVCADEATPEAGCSVAEKVSNATEGAVAASAELLGEALDWKDIYQDWDGAREGDAYTAMLAAMQASGSQAITTWTRTKPRIEASLKIIGKVDRPAAE